jgi:hypothetical protein
LKYVVIAFQWTNDTNRSRPYPAPGIVDKSAMCHLPATKWEHDESASVERNLEEMHFAFGPALEVDKAAVG